MKKQVRRNVFETNSSSMHSLVIKKSDDHYTTDEIMDGIYLHKDGTYKPWNHEMYFGRSPFDCLETFEGKWLYSLASLCTDVKSDVYKELESIAYKYIPGLTKIELPKTTSYKRRKCEQYPDGFTEEQMDELCGEEFDFWCNERKDGELDDWWNYETYNTGSVDENILSGFLEKHNISLEEFITNKKYVVIVDGDEYCTWDKLKSSGLVKLEEIETEYPKED